MQGKDLTTKLLHRVPVFVVVVVAVVLQSTHHGGFWHHGRDAAGHTCTPFQNGSVQFLALLVLTSTRCGRQW